MNCTTHLVLFYCCCYVSIKIHNIICLQVYCVFYASEFKSYKVYKTWMCDFQLISNTEWCNLLLLRGFKKLKYLTLFPRLSKTVLLTEKSIRFLNNDNSLLAFRTNKCSLKFHLTQLDAHHLDTNYQCHPKGRNIRRLISQSSVDSKVNMTPNISSDRRIHYFWLEKRMLNYLSAKSA